MSFLRGRLAGLYLALAAVSALTCARSAQAQGTPTASGPLYLSALPLTLDWGWEAADGDPPDGVAGLDRLHWRPSSPVTELAARGAVRWYRLRIDLSRFYGTSLGFAASGIRDADEVYYDGVRIGGTGSFPPAVERAPLIARSYPIPSRLIQERGEKLLVVRVYHGRRTGTVFRYPPVIDSRATLNQTRSAMDQGILFFLGVALTVAIGFGLFAFHTRGVREYPLFAAFSILLGLYALTLHSAWGDWPISKELPFRLGTIASALIGACYLPAVCGLARVEPPRRFRVYYAWFLLLAFLGAVVPDTEMLVWPSRIHPFFLTVALLDLLLPLLPELRARRPRVVAAMAGHVIFLAGTAMFAGLIPALDSRWGVPVLAAGFFALATTFLWAMSDQLTRFRIAALTDPGTRLWNREALFEEISARVEPVRRTGRPFGLIIVDLDHFKEWNDRKGHLAGDRLLLRVARALQDVSRPGDLVARYGGDEFAVVLENVDGGTAEAVSERFHSAVEVALRAEAGESMTASIGVAVFNPVRHPSATALFHDADRALYDAKAAGRNRVVLWMARTPSDLKPRRDTSEAKPLRTKSSGEHKRPRPV